jgi:hypothetical protein
MERMESFQELDADALSEYVRRFEESERRQNGEEDDWGELHSLAAGGSGDESSRDDAYMANASPRTDTSEDFMEEQVPRTQSAIGTQPGNANLRDGARESSSEPAAKQLEPQSDGDSLSPEEKALQKGKLAYGCSHYKRRCRIRAPCCGEVFTCRHCHNEAKNAEDVDPKLRHDVPRHEVATVVCMLCETEQPVAQSCKSCSVRFGEYFCEKCRYGAPSLLWIPAVCHLA